MTNHITKTDFNKTCSTEQNNTEGPSVIIMNAEEFCQNKENFPHNKELLHSLGSIRYCKAELFNDCIQGTLRIPKKSENYQTQLAFSFYMTENSLFFIEETGDLKKWFEKQADRLQNMPSADQMLLQLMERLIEDDILYLSHLEKEMEKMEDELNDKKNSRDFFSQLTKYRRKLSEFNSYYEQLSAIGDLIQSNGNPDTIDNTESWQRYTHRTERLQNYVHLLQENVLQLRELYQSQQDASQNKIMCILTVVTTLFLPLTLLTGWYGMNFSNMPELDWEYGYLTVIIAAVIIVLLEILYFKKKKLF